MSTVVLGPPQASPPLELRDDSAKYKAGREVFVLALTQLAWNVRHFLLAEGSTPSSGDLPEDHPRGCLCTASARLRLKGATELSP